MYQIQVQRRRIRDVSCAALLWDEYFNTIPGTVNVNQGAAAQAATCTQESKEKVFNSKRMPPTPETQLVGSSASHLTFSDPLCQPTTSCLLHVDDTKGTGVRDWNYLQIQLEPNTLVKE